MFQFILMIRKIFEMIFDFRCCRRYSSRGTQTPLTSAKKNLYSNQEVRAIVSGVNRAEALR